MLLDYGCDAALQFRGQSAVDLAMTRNMTLLDLFVKNSKVNLNSVINETNQTLLTKIFNFKYFRTMDRTDIITTVSYLDFTHACTTNTKLESGPLLALLLFTKI